MNPILEINQLRVEFRSRDAGQDVKVAVNGLDLHVNEGEVFGFLGPNGAGKTTTINVLLGFANATSGEARLFGVDVRQPISRQRIGYLPELTYYYKFLTAEELLRFYGKIFRIPRADLEMRIDDVLKLVDLNGGRKRQIRTYSKGMQQRVGLAQALINNPDLLILDEPTSGLDPIGRMKVRSIIQRLKTEGKTVFFSSHELGEVETVCDRVAILHQGELKVVGKVSDLMKEHQLNLEQVFLKVVGYQGGGMNNVFAISQIVIKELYRRKDFYVLFILTTLITILMGSLNFFNDDKIVRYLKEICLLLIWISSLVIAIGTTARQIPAERENRTIFPLLAKPVTRAQVLLGKFAGCWFACGLCLAVFYLFFAVVCAVREHDFLALNYCQALWLHWMLLAILISMTLLGSIVLTTAANATICFLLAAGLLSIGRHLNKVALQMSEPMSSIAYAIYYVIPHMEFYDLRDLIIHNWEPVAWPVVGIVSLYGAAYSAFFLMAAWLLFRRKALQ